MSDRPRYLAALFSALQFHDPHPERLSDLDDREWEELLAFSDRAHLTLNFFGRAFHEHLPAAVRQRIGRNFADNTARLENIRKTYREVADVLGRVGAEHLILKGFSQAPEFVADSRLRMQSDIDLYCPDSSVFRARDALRQLGYADVVISENNTSDHIAPLVRRNGWRWRGNAFDPEMPPSVELHYRMWNASHTRLGPFSFGGFWYRRVERQFDSDYYTALHPIDNFTYCGLHALRHLLLGGLLPAHIYELGFFLDHNFRNDQIWKAWLSWHEDGLRHVVAVPALLAAQWFGCRLPDALEEEIHRLPSGIRRWFRALADAPLAGLFEANKDALWLHLALIDSARDKYSFLARQLFPFWLPPLGSKWVQQGIGKSTCEQQSIMQNCIAYVRWFINRSLRHLRLLPPTLWHGLRMWSS